jgi:predicted transcriptional regulator
VLAGSRSPTTRRRGACRTRVPPGGAKRYDIDVLGRGSIRLEQVCHRLTSLRRPGAGVPFHMMRLDVAGNISSGSPRRDQFARFSGVCARGGTCSTFLTPG